VPTVRCWLTFGVWPAQPWCGNVQGLRGAGRREDLKFSPRQYHVIFATSNPRAGMVTRADRHTRTPGESDTTQYRSSFEVLRQDALGPMVFSASSAVYGNRTN